jgi:hypothetical protein
MPKLPSIMTQIADIERKIFDFHFPAYGSLYHKKDLAGETQGKGEREERTGSTVNFGFASFAMPKLPSRHRADTEWLDLTTDETKDIMTQIADIERKIFDFHFPAYGRSNHREERPSPFTRSIRIYSAPMALFDVVE